MPHTTMIISDTHLGRPRRTTVETLRPLWQGIDELIINGDAAEVQMPRLRAQAVREIEKLDELTAYDGVKLRLISGNHDAFLTDTRCIQRADGDLLIMHGDALHPSVAPWTRSASAMRAQTEDAFKKLDRHERDCLHARLTIAQHVGHSEFLEDHVLSATGDSNALRVLLKPWEVPRVLAYWKKEPALAEQFLDRYAPQARFLVLGHSHHAGVWRRGDRVVINTGGFTFPAKPWCVLIRDNELTVHRIRWHNGVYRRAGQPAARFLLASTPADGDEA